MNSSTVPLTADRRQELLLRSWELRNLENFVGLEVLLASLSTEQLLQEPQLALLSAMAFRRTGHPDRALRLVRRLRDATPGALSGRDLAIQYTIEGSVLADWGVLEPAEAAFNNALAAATTAGDQQYTGYSLTNLGAVEVLRGNWAEAIALCQRALVISRQSAQREGMFSAHNHLALSYHCLGLYHEAQTQIEASTRFAVGDYALGFIETNRARILVSMGDYKLAEIFAIQGAHRHQGRGYPGMQAEMVLSSVATHRGEFAVARRRLSTALKLAPTVRSPVYTADVWRVVLELEIAEGNHAAARKAAAKAARLYAAAGAHPRAKAVQALLASTASQR